MTSRRDLLRGAALGALACAEPPPPPAPAPPDPFEPRSNGAEPMDLVVVVTDDQRYDALGFLGHPLARTPVLDRMASEGVSFANSFVTTSLCCPSRATMWTGLYAHDHGVLGNRSDLAPDQVTWPRLLQRAGYRTAFVGKWHMGAARAGPRPGFDHWVAFRGQGQYFWPGPDRLPPADRAFDVDGVDTPVSGYVTDLLTERAVAFIDGLAPKQRFALVLAHKAVHAPHEPAPRHAGALLDGPTPSALAKDDALRAALPRWLQDLTTGEFDAHRPYGGRWPDFASWALDYHRTLMAVDESVGAVLGALERTGRLARTAVLFTSDNGMMMGERGVLDKRCFYEESIRVPLIVRAPDVVRPGRRPEAMVLNLDLAPTLLDLGGVAPPESMAGRSLRPLLRDEPVEWRTEWLYEYFYEKAFPETPTMMGLRTADHKLWTFHGVPERDALFALRDDPGEWRNRIDDPDLADRRRGLMRRLRLAARKEGLLAEPVWGRSRVLQADAGEDGEDAGPG